MSLFRSTRSLFPVTRRRFALPIQQHLPIQQQRFATQDYGSGDGNPAGEKPQDQGTSQIARDLEHPGPDAPSAGQNGGSSSTSSGSSGQGEQEASSTESKSSNGAQPKILNESPPKDSEASEDVQQHNREMDQRADRANEKVGEDDTVGKKFWKGTGGVDEKVQHK